MRKSWIGALATLLACGAAQAELTSVSANGFELQHQLVLKAEPARVYDALADVGRWWNPVHSYSGEAARLSLDARAGGCFCETLKDGGSVRHGVVVFAQKPALLRFEGALGPLQTLGVSGVMSWALKPGPGGATRLTAGYRVGGYLPAPVDPLAGAVDGVIGEQMRRLKAYVETGKPD